MEESNQYLIAANTKNAQLIFGMFKWIDLIILLSGSVVTFTMFIILSPSTLPLVILVLLPLLICATLVIPIPNYHNVLCILKNIYNFYFVETNKMVWKGWRVKDEYK